MPVREPDDLDALIAALKRALRPDAAPPSAPREGYGLDTAEAISPLSSPHERTMAPGAWDGLTQQEKNERLAMMAGEAGLALASASPAGRAAVGEVAPPNAAGGRTRPSQRPGYRAKPQPTDFAARNMEALSPEARAALRARASDSELRYELAGLTRKDAQLRAKLDERIAATWGNKRGQKAAEPAPESLSPEARALREKLDERIAATWGNKRGQKSAEPGRVWRGPAKGRVQAARFNPEAADATELDMMLAGAIARRGKGTAKAPIEPPPEFVARVKEALGPDYTDADVLNLARDVYMRGAAKRASED